MTGDYLRKLSMRQVVIRVECVQTHPPFNGSPEAVHVDIVTSYKRRIQLYWGRIRIFFTSWGFPRGEPLHVEVAPFLFTDDEVDARLVEIARDWERYSLRLDDESVATLVRYDDSDKVDQIKHRGLFMQLLLSRCAGVLYGITQDEASRIDPYMFSHPASLSREVAIRLCGWLEATRKKWEEIGAI